MTTRLVGALCIAAATLAAILLTPAQPQAEGALRLPASILCTAILVVVALDVWSRGMQAIARAENVVIVGLIYWILLDLVTGSFGVGLARELIQGAFLATGVFAVAFLLATLLPTPRLASGARSLFPTDPTSRVLFVAIIGCFLLGIFYYIWSAHFSPREIWGGLQRGRFDAPWSRGALGGWPSLVEALTYFGFALPTLTILLYTMERRVNARLLASVAMSAIFLVFLSHAGGRRYLGMVIGSAILTWVFLHRGSLRWRHAIIVAPVAVAVLMLLNLVASYRSVGVDAFQWQPRFVLAEIHVDDNFLRLGQLLEMFPRQVAYLGASWLYYVAAQPIPRALWPDKPIEPWSLAHHLGYDTRQGAIVSSLSSSVIGEWYFTWGWIGIVVGGSLLGYVAATWSTTLVERATRLQTAWYAMGVMVLFISLRSMLEFVWEAYPLVTFLALHLAYTRRVSRASEVATEAAPP